MPEPLSHSKWPRQSKKTRLNNHKLQLWKMHEPTREKLDIIYEWLEFEDWENLEVALETAYFESVLEELKQMENQSPIYTALKTARERLDLYKANHEEKSEDYVKRINTLRHDSIYIQCKTTFEQNKEHLKKELDKRIKKAPNPKS